MASHIPCDQDKVFYTMNWTREVEDNFINVLADEALHGRHQLVRNNNLPIRTTMLAVNKQFRTTFNFMCCYVKYLKLKQQLCMFKWIIMLSGVSHNPLINEIKCSQDAWAFICKKEKFTSVYMLKGEQKHDELKCLFDDKLNNFPDAALDQPNPKEVIEISSDHDDRNNGTIVIGVDDEDDANNVWWVDLDPLAEGDDLFLLDDHISAPTAYSSNEPKKAKEKITPTKAKKVTHFV